MGKKEKATLGDFLVWLQMKDYHLRAMEQINRDSCDMAWNFQYGTALCRATDREILKTIPERTERDWKPYGR